MVIGSTGRSGWEDAEAYSDEEDEEIPLKPSEIPLALSPQPVVELFKEMLIEEWEGNSTGGAIFKACMLTIKKLVSDHMTADTVKETVTGEQLTVMFGSALSAEWRGPSNAMDALLQANHTLKLELMDLIASNHVASHGKEVAKAHHSSLKALTKLAAAQQSLMSSLPNSSVGSANQQMLTSTRQALLASSLYGNTGEGGRSQVQQRPPRLEPVGRAAVEIRSVEAAAPASPLSASTSPLSANPRRSAAL